MHRRAAILRHEATGMRMTFLKKKLEWREEKIRLH